MRRLLALALLTALSPEVLGAVDRLKRPSCSGSDAQHVPTDSPCQKAWPDEGPLSIPVHFADNAGRSHYYGDVKACVYYEVCSPTLDQYINEARSHCPDEANRKRCVADYLFKKQKNAATKLNPYDLSGYACCAAETYPEWDWFCRTLAQEAPDPPQGPRTKSKWAGRCDSPGGQGPSDERSPVAGLFDRMPCIQDGKDKPSLHFAPGNELANSCLSAVFPPTSLATEKIKASNCTVDSAIMTTLLRKAGYSKSEVMTVSGRWHFFTIVKLPGDATWTVPEGPSDWCRGKWIECHNDTGRVPCPRRQDVPRCEEGPALMCPEGCLHDGRCYLPGEEACVEDRGWKCVAERQPPVETGSCGTGRIPEPGPDDPAAEFERVVRAGAPPGDDDPGPLAHVATSETFVSYLKLVAGTGSTERRDLAQGLLGDDATRDALLAALRVRAKAATGATPAPSPRASPSPAPSGPPVSSSPGRPGDWTDPRLRRVLPAGVSKDATAFLESVFASFPRQTRDKLVDACYEKDICEFIPACLEAGVYAEGRGAAYPVDALTSTGT